VVPSQRQGSAAQVHHHHGRGDGRGKDCVLYVLVLVDGRPFELERAADGHGCRLPVYVYVCGVWLVNGWVCVKARQVSIITAAPPQRRRRDVSFFYVPFATSYGRRNACLGLPCPNQAPHHNTGHPHDQFHAVDRLQRLHSSQKTPRLKPEAGGRSSPHTTSKASSYLRMKTSAFLSTPV